MKEEHFIDFLTSKTETFYHLITWLKAWKRGYIFKLPFLRNTNYRYSHVSSQIISKDKNNNHLAFYTLYNLKTVINRLLN